MASLFMHLYVGHAIARQRGDITDIPQYYLGCFYPDCVNAFGFAPREVRYPAHLRAADIDEWVANCHIFFSKNIRTLNMDFLLGYMIHNITDAMYDRHFNHIDRAEWGAFNFAQSHEPWWTHEVLPELKNAQPISVNGVDLTYVTEYLKNAINPSPPALPPREANLAIMDKLTAYVQEHIKGLTSCTK